MSFSVHQPYGIMTAFYICLTIGGKSVVHLTIGHVIVYNVRYMLAKTTHLALRML